jgi:cytochrome c oxidase subunit 1
MTMTDERPETAAPTVEASSPPETWITTGDHKKLGLLFVYGSLLFLAAGGVLAMLLRTRLAEPTSSLLGDDYTRVFATHAAFTTLLFLVPVWIGLATYLVPLQIGAGRVAYPRLHAWALGLYVVGAGLLVAASVAGTPSEFLGFTAPVPPAAGNPADHPILLWIVAMMVLALSTFLAHLSLLVTTLALRTEGMTFRRMPAFSWSVLVTSAVTVLSTPVFLVGLVLVFMDQRFGGSLFDVQTVQGSQIIWQHTVWLFGRPEIYLLTLPGLGVACDIVATHSRRALEKHDIALGALAVFGILSFAAWTAGVDTRNAVVLPTYTVATALIALPIGVLVLTWLNTARLGRPRFNVSLLFVVGYILLLVAGAANVIAAAAKGIDSPSAWTTGNLHMVAFGAPTLLVFGALYHWAPKLWGRRLSQSLGAVVFLLLFGGFFVNGMASYLLGYKGAPNHVVDLAHKYQALNRVALAGGGLVALGLVVFLFDVLAFVIGHGGAGRTVDDPYDGLTLEWATTSPPPPYGFDSVPEVRSPAPLADVRAIEGATTGGKP